MLPRHSFALSIVHHCPALVQYSCMADGLQAATGASPAKHNLTVKVATADALKTVVANREKGRYLIFVLEPDLVASIRGFFWIHWPRKGDGSPLFRTRRYSQLLKR